MALEHFINAAACYIMVISLLVLPVLIFMSICEGMFGTALTAVLAFIALSMIAYSSDSFEKLSYNGKIDRYNRYVNEFGVIQPNKQETEHFNKVCSHCSCNNTNIKKEELDNE